MEKSVLKKLKSYNPKRTAAKWLLKKSMKLAYSRGSVVLSAAAAGIGVTLWKPPYKRLGIPCVKTGMVAGLSILLPALRSLFRLKAALGLIK